MIDLTGKRVLVTGGSRGIGAACCRLFAEAGASVWVHYRRERAQAEEVLRRLPGGTSTDHRASAANLAERSDVQALLKAVDEAWGVLDCVVNNAGIWGRNPLSTLDETELEETWNTNVIGPFWVARYALSLLSGRQDASIVNLTSTAGQRGEPFHSAYAASKGALIAATKSWAVELSPSVRVNSVAPGWVDTDMSAEAYSNGGLERITETIPTGRIASAEDIAGAVLFLASPLARQVTGEILNVNGGSVLCG